MTFQNDKPEPKPSSNTPAQTNYDTVPPPALLDFMTSQWKQADKRPVAVLRHAASFAARRRALSHRFPGELLVIPTGHEKVRSNDTTFRFRPGTDFYYLSGNIEPDCVLVLEPDGDGHQDVLFVEPNPGRTNTTFYTDRAKGELWVGPRLGTEASERRFAVHQCRGLPELKDMLAGQRSRHRYRVLRGLSAEVDALFPAQAERDKDFATFLSEMRLLKDAQELRELSAAIASTHRGFEDVIRGLRDARSEREVEGIFNLRARVEGNDVGYGTIAASGANACILHWTRNDGKLSRKELLLLDAGVESNSLYTADITRTLPIGGRFTKEQRDIYQLVHDAQAAAFKACRPGNDFMEPNRRAMDVLSRGLERLHILPVSAAEAMKDEKQFYKRYSLHNVSHMLGLDVHDCAKARQEAYKFGTLKPGMVLTVEPGLYFQLDDLTVPAKYRGIGVRIEDDVVITEKGYRNLSRAIPSEADAVEAWMAKLWKKEGRRS
jgi:Xaa-Pro aminopeptidase